MPVISGNDSAQLTAAVIGVSSSNGSYQVA